MTNNIEDTKLHICFVAHLAYGALAGGEIGHIGGVERQTSLMAKWLANHGYKVSMVTWNEGQEDGQIIDGVKVFKMCAKEAGVKGLRFFWPKWTSLNAAMKRANADIYYQNCGEYVTGQVALWCRKHDRKFIYSVASDPDCDYRLPEMHAFRERVLYRYGLKRADKIIVQTRKQKEMIRAHFGRDSVVIPMPCPGPSDSDYADCLRHRNNSHRVLWLGRICEQKRPDWLLDIAQIHPELTFDFVGPQGNTAYARSVCERAKTITNIKMHGLAGREQVREFYKKAKIFCCTSEYEGFPNTFLEAWSFGLPIVSTFDPDNLIVDKGLGIVGTSVAELAAAIHKLVNYDELWYTTSQSAREYYLANHAVDRIMEQFEKVFTEELNSD